MELTAEVFIIVSVLSGIFTIVGTLVALDLYSKWRFGSIFEVVESVKHFFKRDGSQEHVTEAVDSLIQVGGLASNANAILADEALLVGFMSKFANMVMQSVKGSMMGTASGDIKKKEYAERRVNEALIEGITNYSPAVKAILKITGLDEEIKADPELFMNIMEVILNNEGLMNMIGSFGGIEGLTNATPHEQGIVRDEIIKRLDF